jgi:DNA-binding NarL/FixJ family response regulator
MVEPRNLLGAGVREILDREADIEVVAQVETSEEALPVVEDTAPDIVLMSAPLSDPPEDEATMRLRHESPGTAFVVLGGPDDDASIAGAIEIRAMGHVSEVAQPAELVETIRRVAHGEDVLKDELDSRPDLVDRMIEGFREAAAAEQPAPCPLTARELDILALVAEGLRNRDIAVALDVSEQTVKNHLAAAMHKLGARNRTRAVLSAIRHEWLPAPEGKETEPTPTG